MANLIENYFEDYNNIIQGVNSKISETNTQFGTQRRTTLNFIKSELSECDDILSQIELEMSTPQLKQSYGAEHREKSELLSKLRREINDLIKSSDRHDLLGDSGEATTDSPYNNDERGGLLQGLDRVEDGNRRLENSHRVALDTEDIGADILRNLRMQREQIENTHNTLGQADTGIDRSMKTLKQMWRHSIKQKAVTWLIIGVLILLILIVLWGKFM